jgi:uracil-DNA glycosylase
MTQLSFNLNVIDPSWQDCLQKGLSQMDQTYLQHLSGSNHWLPGANLIFKAFSLPLDKVNYVLFGESPYPRSESANGYAFWDASVQSLWSETGFSKPVNRATSLRNFLKMLLVAEGLLIENLGQDAISLINKDFLVKTNQDLFSNLLNQGFLLLNATPVLQLGASSPNKDARAWLPFTKHLLTYLLEKRPHLKLILLGRIAHTIDHLVIHPDSDKIYAEHPYNVSFILNKKMINFFNPLHLLRLPFHSSKIIP